MIQRSLNIFITLLPNNDDGYPVYLTEDWDSGIGGGLWTTGLALGRYFSTQGVADVIVVVEVVDVMVNDFLCT